MVIKKILQMIEIEKIGKRLRIQFKTFHLLLKPLTKHQLCYFLLFFIPIS